LGGPAGPRPCKSFACLNVAKEKHPPQGIRADFTRNMGIPSMRHNPARHGQDAHATVDFR
ncbi:MAG: hypothetical protein WCH98_20355, partial [Verrucomicrobiota bacterium]